MREREIYCDCGRLGCYFCSRKYVWESNATYVAVNPLPMKRDEELYPAIKYITNSNKENEMQVTKSTVDFKSVFVQGHGDVKISKSANGYFELTGLLSGGERVSLNLTQDALKALQTLTLNVLLNGVK